MATANSHYDVFISYAREDSKWVKKNLYEPLMQCRTADGSRPRVFFDLGELGIGIGVNFMNAIVQGIVESDKFVPVYSAEYFRKEMCNYELSMAHFRDPTGRQGFINPILIDGAAEPAIPWKVKLINYRHVGAGDWFEQLCSALDLSPQRHLMQADFLDEPTDITVNHTLPAVRVRLQGADSEEMVTLSAEAGELQGTLTVSTENGIATFRDLSMGTVLPRTRLISVTSGARPAFSAAFAVRALEARLRPASDQPAANLPSDESRIDSRGEVVFFSRGNALVVIEPERLIVYDATGQPPRPTSEPIPLRDRIRLLRRSGGLMALADWSGNIYLVSEDGRCETWKCQETRGGFCVPGDLDFAGEVLYAGFWSGMVYRLALGEQPAVVLKHEPGVQALALAGDRLYVAGLDGKLGVYNKNRRLVDAGILEPSIRMLRALCDCLVALGDRKGYQIRLDDFRVIPEELPLNGVSAVFADSDLPVAIDSRGKGGRINSELVFQGIFVTTAGAVPTAADNAGRYCVFYNPDGSRTLMVDGRIRFSHLGGTLTLAPSGQLGALGDESGIRLLSLPALLNSKQEGITHGTSDPRPQSAAPATRKTGGVEESEAT